jgi:hypothetical protein
MKNWLSHLRYHFYWQSTLGANFPKENDTWFFICKKLPFSLDSTCCCSIVLFFSCKLSPPNVLFTNFSQFSLHQLSGKWTCPYQNRYHSLRIHLIASPLHSTLLSQAEISGRSANFCRILQTINPKTLTKWSPIQVLNVVWTCSWWVFH